MGTWTAWKRPEGIKQGGEEAGPWAGCLNARNTKVFSQTWAVHKKEHPNKFPASRCVDWVQD